MSKALKIPKDVRNAVRVEWPGNKEHAAKQLIVWLIDVVRLGKADEDQALDVALEVGMLAEQQKDGTADAFINAVKEKFRNM